MPFVRTVGNRNDRALSQSRYHGEHSGYGRSDAGITFESLSHRETFADFGDIGERTLEFGHAYFVPQSIAKVEVHGAICKGTTPIVGGPGARQERARPDELRPQSGFALIDVLVGAAIGLVIFGFLVSLLHTMIATAASRNALMLARTQSQQLLERMRSESRSAWSIAVPQNDVFGTNNADGHELDFTTENSARAIYRWAYDYDSTTQVLTRYTVGAGGPPQPGPSATHIAEFSAQEFAASEISNPSSPIYDPLFAGLSITPISYTLPDGSVAGNDFVQIRVTAAGTSLRELLATGIAPTQFTVVVQYTPAP
jgi:Tfp pilus assembly protein PilV